MSIKVGLGELSLFDARAAARKGASLKQDVPKQVFLKPSVPTVSRPALLKPAVPAQPWRPSLPSRGTIQQGKIAVSKTAVKTLDAPLWKPGAAVAPPKADPRWNPAAKTLNASSLIQQAAARRAAQQAATAAGAAMAADTPSSTDVPSIPVEQSGGPEGPTVTAAPGAPYDSRPEEQGAPVNTSAEGGGGGGGGGSITSAAEEAASAAADQSATAMTEAAAAAPGLMGSPVKLLGLGVLVLGGYFLWRQMKSAAE